MKEAAKSEPDREVRMGSEYADARTYLARRRSTSLFVGRSKEEPQHGSNDSDFGIPDQKP